MHTAMPSVSIIKARPFTNRARCALVKEADAYACDRLMARVGADRGVDYHPLWAQGTQDDTELAKPMQNPVADLINIPPRNNFNFSAGPKDTTIYVLDLQPVIPLRRNLPS